MADTIYVADPHTNEVTAVQSVSFSALGVKERAGLQAWVLQNPAVLGEELLVITPEFGRFDRIRRRLDVLALDAEGTLVVIELKLEAEGSLADLQAIRYAAFCSTMRMADVLSELARYDGITEEQAEAKIVDFLGQEELPELGDNPRITLAAGSLDDQELTSCVLWLRRFGIDISCVELTPYRLPASGEILMVPKVIIPLPEARDYIVSVERKEAAKTQASKQRRANEALWAAINQTFNELGLPFQARSTAAGNYSQLRFGDPNVHYEWQLRKRERALHVALHFEHADPELNYGLLETVERCRDRIAQGIQWELGAERWGRKWARVFFRLPYEAEVPPAEIAPTAAQAMGEMIARTWPLIRGSVKHGSEYEHLIGDRGRD